jgi:dTDP-4-dehydrorhamnose reductase
MDRLLVIGATGLIGAKAFELGLQKYETYGTYAKNKKEGLLQLDVVDRRAVFGLFGKIRPDVVFDAHGINSVERAESHKDDAWAIDFEGSRNLMDASRQSGAKYIFISSDLVFSGTKAVYTERDRPDPVNYLGRTKWAVETMMDIFDIDHIIARTSGTYGRMSRTGKKGFPQFIIENLHKGVKVKAATDQYATPTLVDDLVRSVFVLISANAKGIFNIAGKDCISKYDFAKAVCREFELDDGLIEPCGFSDLQQLVRRPLRVKFSTGKLGKYVTEKPVGMKKGLRILHGMLSSSEYF